MKSVSEVIEAVRSWFESSSDPGIDTDYLRSGRYNHGHISVPEEGPARCNLCGLLKPVEQMPAMIDHVAGHDGQGSAEINALSMKQDNLHLSLDEA
jgi:hypothetical protein